MIGKSPRWQVYYTILLLGNNWSLELHRKTTGMICQYTHSLGVGYIVVLGAVLESHFDTYRNVILGQRFISAIFVTFHPSTTNKSELDQTASHWSLPRLGTQPR